MSVYLVQSIFNLIENCKSHLFLRFPRLILLEIDFFLHFPYLILLENKKAIFIYILKFYLI